MVKKDDGIKELEKLSPEERIARLKEIEEEDKKEIERAHELIKESQDEMEIELKIATRKNIKKLKSIYNTNKFVYLRKKEQIDKV